MLTFILGPDGYLARAALDSLRAELDPDGMNTDLVDGRASSIDDIVAMANTPTFFGGSRLVIVDGFLERFGRSKPGDAEPAAKSKQPDISGAFASIAQAQVIFFDRAASSVPVAVKKALPPDARVLTHEAPRGAELVRWMQSQAGNAGAKLPEPLARKLAERLVPKTWAAKPANPLYDVPPELERIAREIEKLSLAAHPGPITAALIDEMTVSTEEDRLFTLIEAIYALESTVAVKDLAGARERGDDPGRIVNSLNQQAELAAALAPGLDVVQIGRELELSNPNRMFGVSKSSARSKRPAKAWIKRLLETERTIKLGQLRDPWDPLYHALDSKD